MTNTKSFQLAWRLDFTRKRNETQDHIYLEGKFVIDYFKGVLAEMSCQHFSSITNSAYSPSFDSTCKSPSWDLIMS